MNNFEILQTLGEGTYSTVYKVIRKSDGLVYALKKVNILRLSYKEKQNALNEIRILASVFSPFIIKYKESFFDTENSCLAIVMEYADEGDLLQMIKLRKKFNKTFSDLFLKKLIVSMVEGLHSLHYKSIFHRDLKVRNDLFKYLFSLQMYFSSQMALLN